MQPLGFTEKYFGSFGLTEERLAFVKKAYIYLLGIVAVAGVTVAVSMNMGWAYQLRDYWWVFFIALLLSPFVIMRYAHVPGLNLALLAVDAVLSGLVLSLIIARWADGLNNAVISLFVTGAIFAGTSLYIFTTRRDFRPLRGAIFGLAIGIIVGILLMVIFKIAILALLISVAIGILGVMQIMAGTSELVHEEDTSDRSAIGSALILWGGIFNLFVSILQLLGIMGGDD